MNLSLPLCTYLSINLTHQPFPTQLSVDDIRRLLVHRTQRYHTQRLATLRTHLGELQDKVRELGLEGELEERKRRGCGGGEGVEDRGDGGEREKF